MWPTTHPLTRSVSRCTELMGRIVLAQSDAAQRIHHLLCRLSLNATEAYVRAQSPTGDDVLVLADRANANHRTALIFEAGAEGCMTIVQHCMDEIAAAQNSFLRDLMESSAGEDVPLRLAYAHGGAEAWRFRVPESDLLSARE